VLTIALWVGTAVLIFAPGNFVRLAYRPGMLMTIENGINLLAGTWTFWLMLAGLAIIRVSGKEKFRNFILSNTLELYMLVVAIAFGMVANTLPQSFNGVSFYSAIILFRMTAQLPKPLGYSRKGIMLTVLLALALFTHQTRLIFAGREQMQINHQFVEDYLTSPDGVVSVPKEIVEADCRPFMNSWLWFSCSFVKEWRMLTLEKHYGKGKKHLILLDTIDYEAYSSPEEFVSKSKSLTCGVEVYYGSEYLWFRQENAPRYNDTIRIRYAPAPATGIRKLYRCIVSRPRPAVIEKKVIVDSTTLVKGKGGLNGVRTGAKEIKNVEILCNKENIKP